MTYVDAVGLARTKTYQQNTPARSVEDVQRIVSAEQDGKYGPKTKENVAEYQKYLKDCAGTYDGPIDGKWGDATEKAHRAQQSAGGKTVGQREDERKNTPTSQPATRPTSQPTSGPATTQPAKPKVMDDPSLASYSRRDREAFAAKMKQQYSQWTKANPDKLHGACFDPLTVVAQWMHETSWGKRAMGHNWGNIKGSGPAGTTEAGTWEFISGQRVTVRAGFRKYHNNSEFYEDYHRLIGMNDRYKAARDCLKGKEFYTALKAAGYATDPKYVENVMALYRQLGGE
jgi:flagellar protein FlgJ